LVFSLPEQNSALPVSSLGKCVARKVVVISEAHRFGQGPLPLQILKLLLFQLKLRKSFDFLRTRGKGYQASAGDGVFYSYSVYDNLRQIQPWAGSSQIFPIGETRPPGRLNPQLTSGGILLIAVCKRQDSPY
jgi:hypothetical protein